MQVRLRFDQTARVRRHGTKNQRLALGAAALLIPVIVAAWILAVWRLASDLGFSEEFAIQRGLFRHWQVWLAVALGLQALAARLNRYGHKRLRIPDSPAGEPDVAPAGEQRVS
jgi:ferric-dicitrate binding protein FerR (iron transport regulator)